MSGRLYSLGFVFVADSFLLGGTTIISAGAQNTSGFTAFAKETIADWMGREMTEWDKVLQIPLPSFAGKDEALFIFEKKA